MRDLSRRLDRVQEVLGALDCVCASAPALDILVMEEGWEETRIRLAEESKRLVCPVHGPLPTPILRLTGSDIYG